MRTPLVNEDPTSSDLGGCIKRYLEKMSPGQIRMYCKVIPVEQRSINEDGQSLVFYANCPLGRNYILDLFKEGAGILGLPNPKSFSAHSLCPMFITKLSNGQGVNDEERMASSRHESVSASAIYQERDSVSESNKFASLGIMPPKKKMR